MFVWMKKENEIAQTIQGLAIDLEWDMTWSKDNSEMGLDSHSAINQIIPSISRLFRLLTNFESCCSFSRKFLT